MTILHLEDINTKTFIDCIEHLNEFVASEKIDGSELIVGFDEKGLFYTSREAKGGQRFYKVEDWPIAYWTTNFRGAHSYLEQWQDALRYDIKTGNAIEVEIICGNLPNTVPYDNDINRIVPLRPVNGYVNMELLQMHLCEEAEKFSSTILVKNVPSTTDGWNTQFYEYIAQNWNFSEVKIQKGPWLTDEIKTLLDKLKAKDIETSLKRITTKNKQDVLDARKDIQDSKDKIKSYLLAKHVTGKRSIFGGNLANSWIEGLVFRNEKTGFQFKLVDKKKFTLENTAKHACIKELRENHWRPFKKTLEAFYSIDKFMKPNINSFDDLGIYVGLEKFDSKQFDEKQKAMIVECDKAIAKLHEKLCKLGDVTHNSSLKEEFASQHLRIKNIREELTLATCSEHLLEVTLYECIGLKHEKKFWNSSPIKLSDVKTTIEYLSAIINVKNLQFMMLGSCGISEFSNDIDLCIDKKTSDVNSIKYLLKVKNIEFTHNQSLDIIHVTFPIKGQSENGYVQIDLILTDNPDWVLFWYKGRTADSKYKGLYRNALLRAIAGASNETKYDKGDTEPYMRKGYMISPKKGLEWRHSERKKNKTGKRNKAFDLLKSKTPITDIPKILRILFPKAESLLLTHVADFENTWHCVKLYKTKKERQLIAKIMIKILKEGKYKIPRELLYDI